MFCTVWRVVGSASCLWYGWFSCGGLPHGLGCNRCTWVSGNNKQVAVSAGCCKCVGGMRCRGLCYATCALKCVCTAWAQLRLCVPVCVGAASPPSGLRRHSCGTVQVSRLELSVVGFGGLLHPAFVVGGKGVISPSGGMFSCALFPYHHSAASAAVQLGTEYTFHTPAVPLLLMAGVVALC
jgi:hypothetical protein